MFFQEKDKNQSTKEKILLATINASVKQVKNPYSLCNIAKDVGISKPAIFKYFRCKESLINAAISKAFDDVTSIYIQVKNQYQDDVEKIIQYFTLWLLKNPSYLSFILSNFITKKNFSSMIVTEFASRGVKLKKDFLSKEGIEEIYVISSIIALMSCVFKYLKNSDKEMSLNQFEEFAEKISKCICYGITKDGSEFNINYERLDQICENGKNQVLEEKKKNSDKDENQTKNETRFFNALAAVIKKHSFSGVTIENLAEEAGLAKSSLYTWYKNKDDLLKKVIFANFSELKDLLEYNFNLVETPIEKSYVILKTEMTWLLEHISVLPVVAWLNFSENGTIDAEEIIFSDSIWANNLFDVKNQSKLISVWMTCLPVPIVLEGCCKDYSRDFLENSVQKIHSMFWNGILHKNKEYKNEAKIKN